jgi:hypothetical protein
VQVQSNKKLDAEETEEKKIPLFIFLILATKKKVFDKKSGTKQLRPCDTAFVLSVDAYVNTLSAKLFSLLEKLCLAAKVGRILLHN